ncbi:hypothetical protein PBRA_002127 [Plasmodiophora brassicae]|uniref:PDZ domain-containing protein n=1 Tax=Plasmodiophora brassicae TaxID=37360 RepID=A0A0G4J2K3_PLABS|nr:hypothetical protein PBRA_002127 [Plasmodiophora brassicae]
MAYGACRVLRCQRGIEHVQRAQEDDDEDAEEEDEYSSLTFLNDTVEMLRAEQVKYSDRVKRIWARYSELTQGADGDDMNLFLMKLLTDESALPALQQFAVVRGIEAESPAAQAGFRMYDAIVRFGPITATSYYYPSMAQIAAQDFITGHLGKPITVVVGRDDTKLKDLLTVTPRQWGGRGLIGAEFPRGTHRPRHCLGLTATSWGFVRLSICTCTQAIPGG